MISKSYITVRYAETDQMGIVHHSVYPVWFEVARTDFVKKLGMHYSQMEKAGIFLPLAELQCKFISPTYYEDELVVEASIQELTGARIQFAYTVYRKGEDKPVATGSTVHAWTDANKRNY
jgi:acyl-CoA thioester hydrolase